MSLLSKLFRGDPALEACLLQDPAHVTSGSIGNHVSKIQTAPEILDNACAMGESSVTAANRE